MSERLVVAMCTYRRPEDLAEALPLLVQQCEQLEADASLGMTARVQVVDNDPDASARPVIDELGLDRVTLAHEPVPGISAARSRCLAEAADDDWLVFIDDDERPVDGWLQALVSTARRSGATGVAGPVRSILPPGTDEWIVQGGFFDRRHRWGLESGAPITEAATNNLLVDMNFVREHGLDFARHLGLTGGEDSLFTRALAANGGRLMWCAEATVEEPVPANRATRRWVLQRALSYGNAAALVQLTEGSSVRVRLSLVGRGGARLVGGLGRALVATGRRDVFGQAQGLRTAMRGVGMALGGCGLAWSEYAREGSHLVRVPAPGAA
ncbi:glycosyltransferase family 2 protein [Luteococcus sp. Sow4_B9]|uniref:glycosyltransferase family 2 protein n=1 Tax=Luteococcus sp. Sow4_B9 TaxID=3438792 RepID=UPI003F999606